MSTVRLISFAIYTSDLPRPTSKKQVKILAGASEARISADGTLELVMASIPMRSVAMARRTPKGGLLMLYGLRDTAEELQRVHEEARRLNAFFAFSNIEVDVGHIEVGLVDRALLHKAVHNKKAEEQMRFLNVRRMKSDLQIEILESFVECAGPHGGIDENLTMFRVSQIATRPDLWDKVFEKDKDLKKLDVLVIPIADDPATKGMRQVAYVRPGAKITSIVQGSDHVQLVLPDWMQKESKPQ